MILLYRPGSCHHEPEPGKMKLVRDDTNQGKLLPTQLPKLQTYRSWNHLVPVSNQANFNTSGFRRAGFLEIKTQLAKTQMIQHNQSFPAIILPVQETNDTFATRASKTITTPAAGIFIQQVTG